MFRHLSKLAALLALLAAATFAQASIGICPQSDAVGIDGIGDGCSLPPGSQTALPALGAFKGAFTESCNWHDKCYSTIGTNNDQCDSNLLSDMRGACSNNYPSWLMPSVYSSCIATAGVYYAGVRYNTTTNSKFASIQLDALRRARAMEVEIRLNHCATTVSATTLFDNGLVSQINSAWQTYAHRLPTIYEVFDVVDNGPNIITSRADWNTFLLQKAAAGAAYTPPVVNTPTWTASMSATAAPVVAGVQYVWSLNGAQTTGSTTRIAAREPKYNTQYTATGFVTGTSGAYAPAFPASDAALWAIPVGARSVAVIDHSYTETGWCGPSPKQQCF